MMSKSIHTYGFEVGRFIAGGMERLSSEDRKAAINGILLVYCQHCGGVRANAQLHVNCGKQTEALTNRPPK